MIDFDALVLAPCMAAFGEAVDVTYYSASAMPLVLTGPFAPVFNDKYVERKFDQGTEITELKPMLNARRAAFPADPVQDDAFLVRGRLYTVTKVDPDSMGDLKIMLRFASDAEATDR